MIKDFIKRLNDLGYFELNDNFNLAQIKESDKLRIQTINHYLCAIYIEPEKITVPLNIKKIGFIDPNIVNEVLF